jgi:DNA-binding NarL/FixJ family response regulator
VMEDTGGKVKSIAQKGRSALIVARPGSLRDVLCVLLQTMPQIQTVDLASDVSSALEAAAGHRLILVLTDASPSNGRDTASTAVRMIKAREPATRCLVLADDVHQRQAVESAGADVALVKGFPAGELLEVIEGLLPE